MEGKRKDRVAHSVDDAIIKENVANSNYSEEEKVSLEIFANRLNEELQIQNISQIELAKEFHISTGALSNYRTGMRFPDAKILAGLSKRLNVSLDYLFGITEEKSTDVEFKRINEVTGLSDKSIDILSTYKDVFSDNKLPKLFREEAKSRHKAIDFLIQSDDFTGIFLYIARYLWDTYQSDTKNIKELEKFYDQELEKSLKDKIILKTTDNRNVSLKTSDINKINLISIEERLQNLKKDILNKDI